MLRNLTQAIFFILFTVCASGVTHASSFDALFAYLNTHYPSQYQVLAEIDEIHKDQMAFTAPESTISRGHELLILKHASGVPQYLLSQAGVIRVTSTFDDKILAKTLSTFEPALEKGDLVVRPASPVIYLYTNIKDKDSFPLYTELATSVLDNNYELVEVYGQEIQKQAHRYGLVLRFETSRDKLSVKLQSLYSGDTFFVRTIKNSLPVQTTASAGIPLHLSPASPMQDTEAHPSPETHVSSAEQKGEAEARKEPQPKDFHQAAPLYQRDVVRLDQEYSRFVICQAIPGKEQEFVMLRDDGVDFFKYQNDSLQNIGSHSFSETNTIGLHIHAMDLTSDGKDEVIVTLGSIEDMANGQNTTLRSQILAYDEGQIQSYAQGLPYYFRVIEDRNGEKILIGQEKGKHDPFSGDIYQFSWDAEQKKLLNTGIYEPAANIYSVYQFNLLPQFSDHVLIIEPSNDVGAYYTPGEELRDLTDKEYGQYRLTPYPIVDAATFIRTEEQKSHTAYAPRRFMLKKDFDGQCFLIDKQRQMYAGLNKVKNIVVNRNAEDSLVGLKWNGQSIQETWRSKKISKDIYDFGFYSSQGEDEIFVLVRDKQGFSLQTL